MFQSEISTAPAPPPLLKLRGIGKTFAGARALSGVDLDLFPGEVHALLGENGAGKSTLMKVLFGVVKPDSGSIAIEGQGDVTIANPRHALAMGIGLVSQELSLVPQLEVAQNIFLGQAGSASLVSRRRMRTEAARILKPMAPTIRPSSAVSALSMAERQVVEIARTIARGGRVIAFDEPTSSLTTAERDGLFGIIRELRQSGKAIVYISHRMAEIRAIADRVTVLRDGVIVASGPIGDFSDNALNELVAGRQLNEEFGRAPAVPISLGPVLLHLEQVATAALKQASLTLRAGEIVGLTGLVGSGRTEVARAIFGIDPLTAGHMSVAERRFHPQGPGDAIRAGIALIPEDRRREALVPLMTVQQNFGLGNERFFSRLGVLLGRPRRRAIQSYVRDLQIRPNRVGLKMRNLSGGNQQKVVIARWLQSGAKVFIFDEPTRGIDIGAKSEVHAVIRRIAEQGNAVLLISSELPELMSLAHRICVMREGTLVESLVNGPDLTEEMLMASGAGWDHLP